MDIEDKGTFYQCKFSRMDVFDLWHMASGSDKDRAGYVVMKVLEMVTDPENVKTEDLYNRIYYISKKLMEFWKKTNRGIEKLKKIHSEWLNHQETVNLQKSAASVTASCEKLKTTSASLNTGRPKTDFAECSSRTKRRRLAELSKVDETAVKNLMDTSNQSDTERSEVDPDDILSLITEAKLTKHQYLLIKEFINSKKSPILPSYQKVLLAKKRCYPLNQTISEKGAEVELQSLLNHTATRILESQKDVLSSMDSEAMGSLILIGKWGFDGSTGHSEYKQTFANDPDMEDGSLFVTSYVPLRLVSFVDTTGEETIVWKNPRPSSTRYCRPVRFQFAKETKELSKLEEKHIQEQIDNLVPTSYRLTTGEEVEVSHMLQLTMVDGKVCSSLSDLSPSRCFLCGAAPSEMNSIDSCLQKEIDVTKMEFGLSPLHAWIRFFEYLVHVSYRLDIKKWQARLPEDKESVALRKRRIQGELKQKLGLIVDKPRSGGSGTSNDGNTARKFFANSVVAAEVTGINKDIIDKCATILNCLSSGYKIDSKKFKIFALDTARLLTHEYGWYNMPASVHKILIHGSEVIEHMMLSVGELSEEAAESSNKNIKLFRLNNTRKHSRQATNTDLLNRLLLNSDPYISGLRKLPRKKKTTLSQSVLSLLE